MEKELIDFTNCSAGNRFYGGSSKKASIVYNGKKYIVKFEDSNRAISEYLGCKLMTSIGLQVQNAMLGTYRDKLAVACEDFNDDEWHLQEFSKIANACLNIGILDKMPNIKDVEAIVETSDLLHDSKESILTHYWEMVVGDAIIGNDNRHSSSWGYLVNERTGKLKIAPIYNVDSSLYPQLSDDDILNYLHQPESSKGIHENLKPALKANGVRLTYLEVLSQPDNDYMKKALMKVSEQLDVIKIQEIIHQIPRISDARKEFYIKVLEYRIKHIIEPALAFWKNLPDVNATTVSK